MKFIGIDLGWQSGPSGLCCLTLEEVSGEISVHDVLEHLPLERKPFGGTTCLTLTALDRKETLAEVLEWVDGQVPGATPAGVAVDAPTLIPNPSGMRLADRLAHRYFGKYDAGCYPANLGRPFAARLVGFGLDLEARGFAHAPSITPQQSQRFQIEVFPHVATIQLFNLSKILKYKKGRLSQRAEALGELRTYLLSALAHHQPPLRIDQLPEIPTTGKALKALEDQLDSILCAYVAAHWWYWGHRYNWVMGDLGSGYIVVPSPKTAPVQAPA